MSSIPPSCLTSTSKRISPARVPPSHFFHARQKAAPVATFGTKSQGQPCKQGETAEQSGCIPASGETTSTKLDSTDVAEFVRGLNVGTKVEINPSGRRIKLVGDLGSAEVQQGAGDGKWRLRLQNGWVDIVPSRDEGLRLAVAHVSSAQKPSKPSDKVSTPVESPAVPTEQLVESSVPSKVSDDRQKYAELIDRRVSKGLTKRSNLSSEQQAKVRQTLTGVLNRMPDSALKMLHRNTLSYRFYEDEFALTKSAMEHSRGFRERLGDTAATERGQSGVLIAGYYDTVSTAVHLVAEGNWPEETYAHELTHCLDGPNGAISRSPEWKEAFGEEILGGDLGVYAETNDQEGLAEFGRLVYAVDSVLARAKYPKCSAVFIKHGLMPEK